MEFINKVELQGIVGNARVQTYGDCKMARFQLATNETASSTDGCMIVDTTWHSVVAWEGENVKCLDRIDKGTKVHVYGRIRKQTYVRVDGVEVEHVEIVANKITIIEQ